LNQRSRDTFVSQKRNERKKNDEKPLGCCCISEGEINKLNENGAVLVAILLASLVI
jgi:hypothetical protein